MTDSDDADRSCTELIERCKRLKQRGAWQALRAEASQALHLATTLGRHADRALAAHLLANAQRALGDAPAAIESYRTSIEAALVVRDRHLLAVGYDNLGNLLRDNGCLDEAFEHYERALEFEDDDVGRASVWLNEARMLIFGGELRSARKLIDDCVDEFDRAGVTGRRLAIALGEAANAEIKLGQAQDALALLARARAATASDDTDGLAANALQQASAHLALEDHAAAGQCFAEGLGRALALARDYVAPPRDEYYRRGFERARASALPIDQAIQLLAPGVKAKDNNRWEEAMALLDNAQRRARQAGDDVLALRALVDMAAVYSDAGQIAQARTVLEGVLHEAVGRGLAQAEAMALGTLAVIVERSPEMQVNLGALGLYTRAAALSELHRMTVAASDLPQGAVAMELMPLFNGAFETQIANRARRFGANALSVEGFERAAAAARPYGLTFQLANRLAGLLDALEATGEGTRAQAVAEELTTLLADPDLAPLGRLVAHRALGWRLRSNDTAAAIGHLRAASDVAEALRERLPRGPQRSEVNRDFPQLNNGLAQLLRRQGDTQAAFEALQRGKARRLIDMLALRSGADDQAPTLPQVQARLHEGDVLVDLAFEVDGIAAYVVDTRRLKALWIEGDPKALTRPGFGDVEEREAELVALTRSDAMLQRVAAAVCAVVPDRSRVLLVPDGLLHNLPLHIVPVDGVPWCDRLPIGFLPAAGVLRLLAHNASRASLVAGDSGGDLLFAADECTRIAPLLGTAAIISKDCTRKAIETQLRNAELDVVLLALHGRGDAHRGGRASLLFADGAGGTQWVAFDELAALRWRANLVVFSGCSTGVAGPRAGHELVSVARAALEAGAASVLACLWPVGDAAAATLMTAFHSALARERTRGAVDLRLLLGEARDALRVELQSRGSAAAQRRRDGPRPWPHAVVSDADDALAWAPFVLLGDPWLPGRVNPTSPPNA